MKNTQFETIEQWRAKGITQAEIDLSLPTLLAICHVLESSNIDGPICASELAKIQQRTHAKVWETAWQMLGVITDHILEVAK